MWPVSCAVVDDAKNLLSGLLAEYVDDNSCCLRFIDRYSLTQFNGLQMAVFVPEWRRRMQHAKTPKQRFLVEAVEQLALRCRPGNHLFLRFVGD